MTPGRLWWLVRRDVQRGPVAAWHDHITGRKIWTWNNPHAGRRLETVPVVTVLGREHLTMATWMLASWTIATGRNWPVRLHDDGTLPVDAESRLRALGLNASVVGRPDASGRIDSRLASLPRCREYRDRVPLALKIFDVPFLADSPRFLLFDPDVLFFRRPDEILRWIDEATDDSCWFNEDVAEASNVPSGEAHERLGLTLWPRVNSGLCLLARRAIDLDFCEKVFADTGISAGHFWRIEQTLFALCASRYGRGGILPSTYEVSLDRQMNANAIARHYVGAVRHLFSAEGVRRLRRVLLRH